MSGGRFDHRNYVIGEIGKQIYAEYLKHSQKKKSQENEYQEQYPKEILKVFEECAKNLIYWDFVAYLIDYLLSGDHGDETFINEIKQFKKQFKNKIKDIIKEIEEEEKYQEE